MKRQRAFVGFVHLNKGINGKWLVLSIVLATVAFASFADSPPVFLTIGGTVNRTVSVTVTPQNNYNSLDLANGETEKLVAIVNERSNDKAGYSVTLTSTGAGSTSQAILQPATPGNPDTISYTLKYGGRGRRKNLKCRNQQPAQGEHPCSRWGCCRCLFGYTEAYDSGQLIRNEPGSSHAGREQVNFLS